MNDIPTRYRECVRELECCTRPACYDDPYYLDVDVDLSMDVDQFSSYDDQFLDVPNTNSISNSRANVTETLISLLQTTPHLERLALSVGGSPTAGLIPVFESLTRVSKFELANWADEVEQPLYVYPPCYPPFFWCPLLIGLFSAYSLNLHPTCTRIKFTHLTQPTLAENARACFSTSIAIIKKKTCPATKKNNN